MTAQYNLAINQAETFTMTFVWRTCGGSAVGATQVPVNLTGYSALLQIRPFQLSTTILYDASSHVTLGGVTGTVTISIPSEDTTFFTWIAGVYDLLMISPNYVYTRLLAGTAMVSPAVSIPTFDFITDSTGGNVTDSIGDKVYGST